MSGKQLKQAWRWYGPADPITLQDIRQAGATTIVTALHEVPIGEVWTIEDIQKRKEIIAAGGLEWGVVESIPLHDSIKRQTGDWKQYVQALPAKYPKPWRLWYPCSDLQLYASNRLDAYRSRLPDARWVYCIAI